MTEPSKTIAQPTEKEAELLRLRYFDGRYLRAEDLTREQEYYRSLIARGNTSLVPGVVHGLNLELPDNKAGNVRVSGGFAIDSLGRGLLLPGALPANGTLTVNEILAETPQRSGQQAGTAPSQTARTLAGFSSCVEILDAPSSATSQERIEVFLIALAYTQIKCGTEAVLGRPCTEPCQGTTEPSYLIDTVAVRAYRVTGLDIDLPAGSSTGEFTDAERIEIRSRVAAALFEQEMPSTAVRRTGIAQSGSLLNMLALSARKDGSTEPNDAALRSGFGRGATSALGDDGWLPCAPTDVPLGLLIRSGSLWDVDVWAVRRERHVDSAAQHWDQLLERRTAAVFSAQINQFQQLLKDVLVKTERSSTGWVDRDRIDNKGITELPSAGYLPVKPAEGDRTPQRSANQQVRNLLGSNVRISFNSVRPDFIPHALQEAQHMERISLQERDPTRFPKLEVFVPDGEILGNSSATSGVGMKIGKQFALGKTSDPKDGFTPAVTGLPTWSITSGAGRLVSNDTTLRGPAFYFAGSNAGNSAPRPQEFDAVWIRIALSSSIESLSTENLSPIIVDIDFASVKQRSDAEGLALREIFIRYKGTGHLIPISIEGTPAQTITGNVIIPCLDCYIKRIDSKNVETVQTSQRPFFRSNVKITKEAGRLSVNVSNLKKNEHFGDLDPALLDLENRDVYISFEKKVSNAGAQVDLAAYFKVATALGDQEKVLHADFTSDSKVFGFNDSNHRTADVALSQLASRLPATAGVAFTNQARKYLWDTDSGQASAEPLIAPRLDWVMFRRAREVFHLPVDDAPQQKKQYRVYAFDESEVADRVKGLVRDFKPDAAGFKALAKQLDDPNLEKALLFPNGQAAKYSLVTYSPSLPFAMTTEQWSVLRGDLSQKAGNALAFVATVVANKEEAFPAQLRQDDLTRELIAQNNGLLRDGFKVAVENPVRTSDGSEILHSALNPVDAYVLVFTVRKPAEHLWYSLTAGWTVMANLLDKLKALEPSKLVESLEEHLIPHAPTPGVAVSEKYSVKFWGQTPMLRDGKADIETIIANPDLPNTSWDARQDFARRLLRFDTKEGHAAGTEQDKLLLKALLDRLHVTPENDATVLNPTKLELPQATVDRFRSSLGDMPIWVCIEYGMRIKVAIEGVNLGSNFLRGGVRNLNENTLTGIVDLTDLGAIASKAKEAFLKPGVLPYNAINLTVYKNSPFWTSLRLQSALTGVRDGVIKELERIERVEGAVTTKFFKTSPPMGTVKEGDSAELVNDHIDLLIQILRLA